MGKKHGKGKFFWSDSSLYSGDFFNNNIHGNYIFKIIIILKLYYSMHY